MEDILGGLAFAGIIAAQLFAVVTMQRTKWTGRASESNSPLERARAISFYERPAHRETDATAHSAARLGGSR